MGSKGCTTHIHFSPHLFQILFSFCSFIFSSITSELWDTSSGERNQARCTAVRLVETWRCCPGSQALLSCIIYILQNSLSCVSLLAWGLSFSLLAAVLGVGLKGLKWLLYPRLFLLPSRAIQLHLLQRPAQRSARTLSLFIMEYCARLAMSVHKGNRDSTTREQRNREGICSQRVTDHGGVRCQCPEHPSFLPGGLASWAAWHEHRW